MNRQIIFIAHNIKLGYVSKLKAISTSQRSPGYLVGVSYVIYCVKAILTRRLYFLISNSNTVRKHQLYQP